MTVLVARFGSRFSTTAIVGQQSSPRQHEFAANAGLIFELTFMCPMNSVHRLSDHSPLEDEVRRRYISVGAP
jgi:hypothetical protein